jgi:hypothetical protein
MKLLTKEGLPDITQYAQKLNVLDDERPCP